MSGQSISIALMAQNGASRCWIILFSFCSLYVGLAAIAWPSRYFTLLGIYAQTFLTGIPMILFAGLIAGGVLADKTAPLRGAVRILRNRGPQMTAVVLGFLLFLTAFTTFKIAISEIRPFYADPLLANIDRVIFGTDAWLPSHMMVNRQMLPVLAFQYEVTWKVMWFAMFVFIGLWRDRTRGARYLLAHALTLIICGTVLATALSSVGPIFYDRIYGGDRFADLAKILQGQGDAMDTWRTSNYLFLAYQSGQPYLGSGISAMPSIHVAVAALNAFFLTSLNRWLGIIAWSFFAVIAFMSVYTGWHYVSDGVLSVIVVSMIWYGIGKVSRSDADG
ncbi:phosphatase PAP2 family protein [Rhizobium sp. BK289]|uniref:phosphatase PAP2 family protein n=2 Tax=Rhizobium TaxID=379 RepID=UPI001FEFF7D0|nr:phosphatase PAP2 family protein [Rhizobium sp. BK289]